MFCCGAHRLRELDRHSRHKGIGTRASSRVNGRVEKRSAVKGFPLLAFEDGTDGSAIDIEKSSRNDS